MASLVPRLAPGSTFAERFRIAAHVGQGSMGHVYRAESLVDGSQVALKIVNLAASKDERAARRFEREAESGARIDSPHVAKTFDSGRLGDSGLAWIAMEFVDGVSVEELVRTRGALPRDEARRLLEQLFSALSAAHRGGIVHRDLTPDNVRVSGEGDALQVKVLDFGIAKEFGVDSMSGTTPGLGTPLWTAPEQGKAGYQPEPRADVWALGLLAFFVLSGVRYWRYADDRASMADLAIELLKGEIEPASRRASELRGAALPAGFDTWFARAVQRETGRRFADASEAWAALEPLLSGRGASAPADRASIVVRPGSFLTLVIVSCVVAGLIIYWLLRSMHI